MHMDALCLLCQVYVQEIGYRKQLLNFTASKANFLKVHSPSQVVSHRIEWLELPLKFKAHICGAFIVITPEGKLLFSFSFIKIVACAEQDAFSSVNYWFNTEANVFEKSEGTHDNRQNDEDGGQRHVT